MKNVNTNELNRAVSLLNFEQENRDEAKKVLNTKYNIPKNYISLILHKIFNKLGSSALSGIEKRNISFWDQFHLIASEEVKSLRIVN